MEVESPQLIPDEHHGALSIEALYRELNKAVGRAFTERRGMWIRGEIQSISDQQRSGHCYMDLVDPDNRRGAQAPTLKVNCWRTTWGPIRALLNEQGLELKAGTVLMLRGRVEIYAPRSQVTFVASELDVSALMGNRAVKLAALIKALEADGFLRANAALRLTDVPLRIGLVGSPNTEGFKDFINQLVQSGIGFNVVVSAAVVQGSRAPASLANAVFKLREVPLDLMVVVRGGGAKADLVAFDEEPVAKAIATCPVPVWTGIGHTGDQSVADLVAHRACITPTQCGQEIVAMVQRWYASVESSANVIASKAADALRYALDHDSDIRRRLARSARSQLQLHERSYQDRSEQVARTVRRRMNESTAVLVTNATRLAERPLAVLSRQAERCESQRRLLGAYDLDRQLQRGYTLTMDGSGTILRSTDSLQPGMRIITRFASGKIGSIIDGEPVDSQRAAVEGGPVRQGQGETI